MASGRNKVTATWDKTSTQQTGTGQGYATTMVVAICFGAMCAPLSGFHLRISPSSAMKAIFCSFQEAQCTEHILLEINDLVQFRPESSEEMDR